MSPEAQRIAIAEACGWTKAGRYFLSDEYPDMLEKHGPGAMVPHFNGRLLAYWPTTDAWAVPPDYLGDLNAMNQAEKVLTLDQRIIYGCLLAARFNEQPIGESSEVEEDAMDNSCRWSSYAVYNGATANAAQRVEAFLRTIGKWTD